MGVRDLTQVKDEDIQNPRHIDIQQLYNMGKTDLEKQCIYLMKKRIALEDVIAQQNSKIAGLHNAVKNRDRMLEQKTLQIQQHQEITNHALERVNKERDEYLQEVKRLQAELQEIKKGVD